MASPKKRVNPLFVALAVVLVAVVAAVGVVFFQLHSKISALQTGASFTFRYEIAPNSPDKPPLLNILERVNASSGSVSGQYAPGKLQLSFYQLNEDDSVKTSPFTRVYIDSEETLFDIGQLYTVLRQDVTDKLSLASVLLPEWSLGDYISQPQAAAALLEEEPPLSDPFLLKDMDKAVARIQQAIENGETIVIFGDYDVDGVSATAILYECLTNLGAQVRCKLPTREGGGYETTAGHRRQKASQLAGHRNMP